MAKKQPEECGKPETVKASFNLNPVTLRKFKYICFINEATQTEIVDRLLSKYIEEWEKKNGPIPVA